MSFIRHGGNDAEAGSTASSEGPEEIRVCVFVCDDMLSVWQDDCELEDIISTYIIGKLFNSQLINYQAMIFANLTRRRGKRCCDHHQLTSLHLLQRYLQR